MLTFNKKINNNLVYPIHEPYNINEIIFFDIETTGFSAKTSIVYLIGCMYYHEENWHILQWLLDDPSNEADLLVALLDKLKSYKRIIHYNGSGFDIPYLLEKYMKYNIESPFSNLESFDLYKSIIPYKKLFPFPNLKLQTLQFYLGFNRNDKHSGGELINTYSQYIGRLKAEKLINNSNPSNQTSSMEHQDILLLHNYDDIVGLLEACDILSYIDFLNTGIRDGDILNIKTDIIKSNLIINIEVTKSFSYDLKWLTPYNSKGFALPKFVTANSNNTNNDTNKSSIHYLIKFKDNNIYIKTPLISSKLKYFFSNYKEYYYLPKEDIAIHKSVAMYVDKEYRIKAKPSNCYTYLKSTFIPVADSFSFSQKNLKTFKDDYKSPIQYVELDNIVNSKENLILWFNSLLDYTISSKNNVLVE